MRGMRCWYALLGMLLVAPACSFDGSNTYGTGDSSDADVNGSDDGGLDIDADPSCQNFAAHFNACSVAPTSGALVCNLFTTRPVQTLVTGR